MQEKARLTHFIKQNAASLGFSFCGVSQARRLDEEASRLEDWLKKGMHGRMRYMENHFDKRLDPRLLVDNAQSVVSFMYSYFPEPVVIQPAPLKISKYARGADYHFVIKEKLQRLAEDLKAEAGEINYRIFVDSAPVLDRAWAVNSGIGWIGKNTMLISRRNGSFFFLAELITDLELEYDLPFGGSYCGDCTRCMDACPTGAIIGPRQLDANRCISYLTIELKDEIGAEFKGKTDNWIFGCDICQDVCPWNKFSIIHAEPQFHAKANWLEWSVEEWEKMDKPLFNEIFGRSALKRTGFLKLKNSISFAGNNEKEQNE